MIYIISVRDEHGRVLSQSQMMEPALWEQMNQPLVINMDFSNTPLNSVTGIQVVVIKSDRPDQEVEQDLPDWIRDVLDDD